MIPEEASYVMLLDVHVYIHKFHNTELILANPVVSTRKNGHVDTCPITPKHLSIMPLHRVGKSVTLPFAAVTEGLHVPILIGAPPGGGAIFGD